MNIMDSSAENGAMSRKLAYPSGCFNIQPDQSLGWDYGDSAFNAEEVIYNVPVDVSAKGI